MWSSMRRVTGIWEDATQSRFFSSPLCAKIRETPSLPRFSVEGGEGNAHEEVRKRCVALYRFARLFSVVATSGKYVSGLASDSHRRVESASTWAVSASVIRCASLYRFAKLFSELAR